MSKHVLVVSLDELTQTRLDAGEFAFPERADSHRYGVVCRDGNGCSGWTECLEPHSIDGKTADCGPYDCDCPDDQPSCLGETVADRAPWFEQEAFEFHGVVHTWRDGLGWTVPYIGCIVRASNYELPDDCERLPLGEYEVQDDWDETTCSLQLKANA